jgi:3-isopropylmalate dehydrogenase
MDSVELVSLPGDGIGSEVVDATLRVLEHGGRMWDADFNIEHVDAGASRYSRTGTAYSEADFEMCKAADAVLLGALGLPDVLLPDGTEAGPDLQFRLRFDLDLYAGVRPVRRLAAIPGPLRNALPFEFTVIRENTEGLYASRGGGAVVKEKVVTDTLVITADGVDRVCRFAFEWAEGHPQSTPEGPRRHVTCVDKANVLRSYAFFRSRFDLVARDYEGQVDAGRAYVDAFCAQMVLQPHSIHVAVAENMFGDIVSDLAAALIGSLGLAPSGDIGTQHGVFQPSHGSAPNIAGKGVANPVATILSAAMMLDWLGMRRASKSLHGFAADLVGAVDRALADDSALTRDVGGGASTASCAEAVAACLLGPDGNIRAASSVPPAAQSTPREKRK